MPVKIECGCSGFHVLSSEGRSKTPVDHHYWRYSDKGKQHRDGKVAGCPLCEMMKGERS